jgi:hypothetical protein
MAKKAVRIDLAASTKLNVETIVLNDLTRLLTFLLACAAVVLVSSCATHMIPKDHLTENAFITSGDNNIWTAVSFFGMVSVVDVDGVVPKHSQGPIELTPGPHNVRLRFQGRDVVKLINAEPGDVFEFAVLTNGSSQMADLYKARSGTGAR